MNSALPRVIVIHGYASSSLIMEPLRYRLSRRGFDSTCWSYASLFQPTQVHVDRLRDELIQYGESGIPFHIVAHSMGSIITRAALFDSKPKGLRRIVFVTPPISGSPVARIAKGIFQRISPAVADLSDDSNSFVKSLPPLDGWDVGIIAAKFDLLVPKASSTMSTQRDHITLAATHNSLLFTRRTADLTAEFLRTGRFGQDPGHDR